MPPRSCAGEWRGPGRAWCGGRGLRLQRRRLHRSQVSVGRACHGVVLTPGKGERWDRTRCPVPLRAARPVFERRWSIPLGRLYPMDSTDTRTTGAALTFPLSRLPACDCLLLFPSRDSLAVWPRGLPAVGCSGHPCLGPGVWRLLFANQEKINPKLSRFQKWEHYELALLLFFPFITCCLFYGCPIKTLGSSAKKQNLGFFAADSSGR